MKLALVTGSCGLIGSAVTNRLLLEGWKVMGLDNNSRFAYFGIDGDTTRTRDRLTRHPNYEHLGLDLRMRFTLQELLPKFKFDLIVHAAGQPSHDLAAKIPFVDFEVNAYGTLVLLELARNFWKEAPFVFLSTNKVYGDKPNEEAVEGDQYYSLAIHGMGIPEDYPVDHSKHSLFGCSKLAADLYVQEYGRYYGLPTCCLRCGCLTGEGHAGANLHGFLSYLVRCLEEGRDYQVIGYGGKQVRDNLHAEDVTSFVMEFQKAPRLAEIYNLGGGIGNACSVNTAIEMAESWSVKKLRKTFTLEPRVGDHKCYYSDLRKIKKHYPSWDVSVSLEEIMRRLVDAYHHS